MKIEFDAKFIKDIAKEAGHSITDQEASTAHRRVIAEIGDDTEEYYYELKRYFA